MWIKCQFQENGAIKPQEDWKFWNSKIKNVCKFLEPSCFRISWFEIEKGLVIDQLLSVGVGKRMDPFWNDIFSS